MRITDQTLLLCDGDSDVVYRKSPLPEKIFAHVSQRGCWVDRISSHAISFQVRRRVSSLNREHTFYFYSYERPESWKRKIVFFFFFF